MLDILQVILWAVTYVLICFYGIKYRNERKRMMPLFSGSLNIAWEINALVWSKGFWGHIIWLLLDVIIFSLNVSSIKKVMNKVFYGIITLVLAGIMAGIFRITVIKSKVCLSVRSTINLNYNMEPLNNNLHLPDLTSYYYIS